MVVSDNRPLRCPLKSPTPPARTTTYIADRQGCRRRGWSSTAAGPNQPPGTTTHAAVAFGDVDGRILVSDYLYLTLMSLHTAYYFFTKSISAIRQRRFADVPACSDVSDFCCPMCTSAELYFLAYLSIYSFQNRPVPCPGWRS